MSHLFHLRGFFLHGLAEQVVKQPRLVIRDLCGNTVGLGPIQHALKVSDTLFLASVFLFQKGNLCQQFIVCRGLFHTAKLQNISKIAKFLGHYF